MAESKTKKKVVTTPAVSTSSTLSLPPVESLFSEAFATLKVSLKQLIIFNLIMLGICAIFFVVMLIIFLITIGGGIFTLSQTHLTPAIFGVPLAVEVILVVIFSLVLTATIEAGTILILAAPNTNSMENIIKRSLRLGSPLVVLGIITILLALPAFYLFFIPGVFVIFFLFLSSYALVINNMGVLGSLRRSIYLVKTHFWGMMFRALLWIGANIFFFILVEIVSVSTSLGGSLGTVLVIIVTFVLSILVNWYGASYLVTIYKQAEEVTPDKAKGGKLLWFVLLAVAGIILMSLFLSQVAKSIQSNPQIKDAFLSGFNSKNSSNVSKTNSSGSTAGLDIYKQTYKAAFVGSCNKTAGSQNTKYCSCIADYLVRNYTDQQLKDLTQKYLDTKALPPEMGKAAGSCLSNP